MDDKDDRIAALEAELADERERRRAVEKDAVRCQGLRAAQRDTLDEKNRLISAMGSRNSMLDAELAAARIELNRLHAGEMPGGWAAELASQIAARHAERKRREDAEAALGEVVDCNNSDPILIAREPGYRWHDVIKQAIAHFSRYKD